MNSSRLYAVFYLILTIWLAYFVERSNFYEFIVVFLLLSLCYVFICRDVITNKKGFYNFKTVSLLFLSSRVVSLFAIPEMSDDFWRYLWDGQATLQGFSPYLFSPDELIGLKSFSDELNCFDKLNSQALHSVYPPISQMIFYVASFIGNGHPFISLMGLKGCVLLAEWLTFIALIKILDHYVYPKERSLIYLLNPLVLMECFLNLHTEVFAICFIAWMLVFLFSRKIIYCSVLLCMAIMTKLIPLLLLPLIVIHLGLKKGILLLLNTTFLSVFLAYLILYSTPHEPILNALNLYYSQFEFNASLYYFFRYFILDNYWELWKYHAFFMDIQWLESFLKKDLYAIMRNTILILELVFLTLGLLGYIRSKRNKNDFIDTGIYLLTIHIICSSVVHPWYLLIILFLSLFSNKIYPWFWSLIVVLSYSHYHAGLNQEYFGLIAVEYELLFIVIIIDQTNSKSSFEIWRNRRNIGAESNS